MKIMVDWLDHRTGCKRILRAVLFEGVPGGARWRYVWGSTLSFALAVQFITGIFLWMGYSPSAHSAWESVYYIQYEMFGGWLLRGIHHYMTQALVILLVLHMMQVIIDGAYRAPREFNFWMGLLLLVLVLSLSLTGYLLPWDQKGFWATKVTTSLISMVPAIGPELQKLVVGGTHFGHHTLTRFFAWHAGVLPALIVVLLTSHIYLFRVHGLTPKRPFKKKDELFWPDQLLKDAVACLAVLAAVLFFVVRARLFDSSASLGAELGAPADPTEPFAAARPEWYFLFLFQFLKYFPGEREIWGAIILPSMVLGFMFLMPFVGRWKFGHRFNIGFATAVFAGAGLLTLIAVNHDKHDPEYVRALALAERNADRIKVLASSPSAIPQGGALALLRQDPFVQGSLLFAKHCASCHYFGGHDGTGEQPRDPQTAPDLKNFASREWIAGLLDPVQITNLHYFGGTKHVNGKMVRTVQRDIAKFDDEEKAQLALAVKALSSEAELPYQAEADAAEADAIVQGRELISELGCTDCHQFRTPDEDATAPDLTGYGSHAWLTAFLRNPAHERFYGERNDRMPAFGEDRILPEQSMELLVRWLRQDW